MPIKPSGWARNKARAVDYFNICPRLFVIDGFAGFDKQYSQKVRILCTRPYHALFMKQMLIRDTEAELNKNFGRGGPDFTVMNAGEFCSDPLTEDVRTKTSVNVNFTDR